MAQGILGAGAAAGVIAPGEYAPQRVTPPPSACFGSFCSCVIVTRSLFHSIRRSSCCAACPPAFPHASLPVSARPAHPADHGLARFPGRHPVHVVFPPDCLVHSLPRRICWPLPQEAQAPTRLRRHRVRVYCSPSRPHVCVLGRPRARAPDAKGGPGISSGRTRRGKRGLWEGAWDGGGLMYVEGRACV